MKLPVLNAAHLLRGMCRYSLRLPLCRDNAPFVHQQCFRSTCIAASDHQYNSNARMPNALWNSTSYAHDQRIRLWHHASKSFSTSCAWKTGTDEERAAGSKKPGFFDLSHTATKKNFNRWMALPPVMAIQGSIGSLYAWSIFNGPLTREIGVIASSSLDWSLGEVVPIFSTTAVVFGCSVWGLGKYFEKIGPRQAGVMSAVLWGSGLAVSGLGTAMHSLPLLYTGYGILGGLGFAFGYISPMANMLTWFPDNRGRATGIVVGTFGAGALLCAPLSEFLFTKYRQLPQYLGMAEDVNIVHEGGIQLAKVGDAWSEIVVATSEVINANPGVVEGGVYVAGTGDTGVAATFLTLSALYTATMLAGALCQKLPQHVIDAHSSAPKAAAVSAEPYVPIGNLLKVPQFYLLWLGVAGNAMAGVAILSCAKTIMSEIFGSQLPLYVDGAFAASYVAGLSVANLGGRMLWAASSDSIGRKQTYMMFGILGVPTLLAIPSVTHMMAVDPSATPVWAFVAGSSLLISCYGGLLGVLPAMVSDTFGAKNTASIFGRCMTGWATAALVGPRLMTMLRESSYHDAVSDLASKVDTDVFVEKFGDSVENVHALVDTKVVTIQRLLEVLPAGTLDPTASLYDTTMYAMAGALGVALMCNAAIRPIDAKFFVVDKAAETGVSSNKEQKC
eukprot:m.426030 g.426030  ORF g.426030 m.426030 type:complete len:673 (+) comp21351_c0_seq1:299-2317(+)